MLYRKDKSHIRANKISCRGKDNFLSRQTKYLVAAKKISCHDVMHHVATRNARKKTDIDFQKISLYG
jgi:hypothetical protein